ncbi:acetate/propionate family kinase [Leeuwenhoekiella sp. A16]|uniref:acetate/propionate family kinase n=1 Tax=unclassified Leeuwenhoekiella TaxID=2615029 RepID=UPI003A807211
MHVLVINSGSSSIKFQLFKMPSEEVIASGMVERIGIEGSRLHYKSSTQTFTQDVKIASHKEGLETIAAHLLDENTGVLKNVNEVSLVGHRVVHGGSQFTQTVIVDATVKEQIRKLFSLAPLHNPHNLTGIEVAEDIFTGAKQIAVFDTAFHQTIPQKAYQYAIPQKFLEENKIRLYGFHGTSHKYVAAKALEYLNKKKSKIITIHLGNGCSMSAIKNGVCIDTSLGFGPVNGLIMGTRSGDIDQSVIFYMISELGYTSEEVGALLNNKSGMLGLTGYSDMRDIEDEASRGNKECILALNMNAYRIKKYIGSYVAALNGLDAIVFTAGIGENSDHLRALVCENMEYFNIHIDAGKNRYRSKEMRSIEKEGSKVSILVIPTNEELEIAQQVYSLAE